MRHERRDSLLVGKRKASLDEDNPFSPEKTVIKQAPSAKKSGLCGSSFESKYEEEKSGPIGFFTKRVRPQMQGVLLKQNKSGRYEEMQFFLKDSLFYSYLGDEAYPSLIVFLLGCFVEPFNEDSRYGLEIKSEHGFSLKLYGTSVADRNEWVQILTNASHSIDVEDDYKFQKICGRGKFSTVYKAVGKENLDEVAIKVIDKDTLDEQEKEFLGTELAIIKVLQH